MTIDSGTVIRLNDSLAIFLGALPASHPQAGVLVAWLPRVRRFRRVTDRDTVEHPAVCHACCRSSWWWGEDLTPVCRACVSPSPEWELALLETARAAMVRTVSRDPVLVEAAHRICTQAFAHGDFDLLQRVQGLSLLHAVCSADATTEQRRHA